MTFMGSETLQEDWWHVDEHHRFNWGLAQGGDPSAAEFRALVAASNKLRLSQAGLTRDELKWVHEDEGNTILAFMRWTEENAALCIVHLGEGQWENDSYAVNTCWGGGKQWKLALNTQAKEFGGWDGSGTPDPKADDSGKIHINIPKWSMLVYVSSS